MMKAVIRDCFFYLTKGENMKKYLKNAVWIAAALCLLLAVMLTASVKRQAEALSERVVRLHVVAASDEPHEQEIKLKVRDAVNALIAPRLSACGSREEAETILARSLPDIEEAARAVYGGVVSVSLGRELFPTRVYETFALPAGEYESLRVTLGAGEGHNWWCVVFPPLCGQDGAEEAFARLGEGESVFIKGDGVVIKFRLVEWLEKMAERLAAVKAR